MHTDEHRGKADKDCKALVHGEIVPAKHALNHGGAGAAPEARLGVPVRMQPRPEICNAVFILLSVFISVHRWLENLFHRKLAEAMVRSVTWIGDSGHSYLRAQLLLGVVEDGPVATACSPTLGVGGDP